MRSRLAGLLNKREHGTTLNRLSGGASVVSVCLDADHGLGPEVIWGACHQPDALDYANQRFRFDLKTSQLLSLRNPGFCVSLRNWWSMPSWMQAI